VKTTCENVSHDFPQVNSGMTILYSTKSIS